MMLTKRRDITVTSDQKSEQACPTPCIEFRVLTTCGRNFVWSAPDEDWLRRELATKNYVPTMLMENAAYEAEQEREAQDMQREFNWKAEREIEEGNKTA